MVPPSVTVGGITSEAEEAELVSINSWAFSLGLAEGVVALDYADPETGEQIAIFDLAWPNGLQSELSEPIALLLNEGDSVVAIASAAGYRCFTSRQQFKDFVHKEVLVDLAGIRTHRCG